MAKNRTKIKKMPEGGSIKPFQPYSTKFNYTPKKNPDATIVPTAPVNPVDQDVLAWTQSYINSPKYQQRLSNFWKYPDYVQRQRMQKLSDVGFSENEEGSTVYSDTYGYPNQLYVGNRQLRYGNISRADAVAHELGHASNANEDNPALRLNPLEEQFIFNRNKVVDPQTRASILNTGTQPSSTNPTGTLSGYLGSGQSHDLSPSENVSDIQSLRYFLNKNKIYDARTQDLTPDVLKKGLANPEIKKQFSTQRLLNNFNEKDLLDILNNVAVNNTSGNKNIAKNGTKVPKYESGGGLSRSKDYGSKSKPYPSVSSSDFAGGGRSYPIPTKADAVDALRLAGLHNRPDVKAKVYAKYPDLKKGLNGIILNQYSPYTDPNYYPQAESPEPVLPLGVDYVDNGSYYSQQAKSGIHIKPENKGKFTATKKRTGKSTEELTHSKNPLTRKRAIFAQNAKKWHHGANGLTIPPFGNRAVSTEENPIYYIDPTDQAPNQPIENVASYFSNPNNNQLINDASLNGNPVYQNSLGTFRDQQYINDPNVIAIQQGVRDRLQNSKYRNYIPNNASLNGPDPYSNEYLMNPDTQQVVQSDYTPLGQNDQQSQSRNKSGMGFNFDINPGAIMTGIMGAVNQIYDNQRGINENTRLKRRNAMAQGYNPNRYGTGSQAIFENGGFIPGKEYELTKDQINFLKSQGYDLEML